VLLAAGGTGYGGERRLSLPELGEIGAPVAISSGERLRRERARWGTRWRVRTREKANKRGRSRMASRSPRSEAPTSACHQGGAAEQWVGGGPSSSGCGGAA
jgi:hypothetical protein